MRCDGESRRDHKEEHSRSERWRRNKKRWRRRISLVSSPQHNTTLLQANTHPALLSTRTERLWKKQQPLLLLLENAEKASWLERAERRSRLCLESEETSSVWMEKADRKGLLFQERSRHFLQRGRGGWGGEQAKSDEGQDTEQEEEKHPAVL